MKATSNPTTTARRRYIVEFGLAMAAYMIVLFGTRFGLAGYHGPWEPIIAVAPALPVFFIFFAAYRFFVATDELARQLLTEALAIAGVVTALASVTYGFLEGDVLPRPSAWWVWVLFMGTTAIASFALRRRYR